MADLGLWLKWLHILGAAVLLGTGAGIAFFFVRANRRSDVRVLAAVARDVVLADFLFTAVAVVAQPLTGVLLARRSGFSLSAPWIRDSLLLYAAIGCCWLPVVWLQLRMRDLAGRAASGDGILPAEYARYYRWWFALGWPAFAGVLTIIWMMLAKRSAF